ncbi:Alb1-domain-containing protein [Scheffersomyces amazonensis]|uniref:Alb1-domain-containing protein n=1 Tax=Scheffersomyces amazonensis TaxID=1078765 RepID=UPI00315CE3EB
MAKKISKHSRAARRGELNDDGEGKDLSKVAKAENNDVKKSIIRTTIKNENLLMKKMENQKIKKTLNKKKSNAIRHRVERNDKLTGVLANKIEQSIARARYVQATRKAGWDKINKNLTLENNSVTIIDSDSVVHSNTPEITPEKTAEDIEKEEEDAYVREFYGQDAAPQDKVEESTDTATPTSSLANNRFALLEETELE